MSGNADEFDINAIIDAAADDAGRHSPADKAPPEPDKEKAPPLTDGSEGAEAKGDTGTDAGKAGGDKAGDGGGEEEKKQPDAVPLADGIAPIEGKVVTQFTIQTPDGKAVAIPDVMIEYKANGKVRKDRLDHVVKMAQFGVYNHDREQQIVAAQEESQRQVMAWQEHAELRDSQIQALLEDPDKYEKVRERYMQENVPEKQVARAKRETETLRATVQQAQAAQAAETFFQSQVLPELDALSEEFPEIETEELAAQLTLAMMPLTRNGVVPPSQYRQVLGVIQTDIRDWAQATHAKRHSKVAGTLAQQQEAAKKAQLEAQRAKNDLARATKPVGSIASGSGDARPARKVESVNDAVEAAMDEVLQGL